jgi:Hypoxia induced protein conserved region
MVHVVNALIPLFLVATTVVLGIGIVALFRGGRFNKSYGNRLMRWRVALQFVTVCLVAAASFFFAR